MKYYALVGVFFIVAYLLPLAGRPMVTPDEFRYAEIPREMIDRGDYVTPHLVNMRYFEKPVMGYWMTAGCFKVFGENAFALRLPAALGAGLAALLAALLIQQTLHDEKIAALAAMLYLTFGMAYGIGTFAVLDSQLTGFVTGVSCTAFLAAVEPRFTRRKAALLVIWGLWYARPIGVDTLYPELEPDIIEVYLSDFTTYRHEDRRLKLTAGTEEFDDLWSEIQELRFRRAPFNVVVQALPFLEGIVDTYVKYPETDDLDTMSISFAQDNGTDIWRSEHLQFDVDAWSYRDFDHGVTLPLLMKNGHEIGQKMAHALWEQAAE